MEYLSTGSMLSTILHKYDITKDDLQRPCEDPLFLVILKKMKYYDEVAPYLGLEEQEIADIGRDQPTQEKKRMAVLWSWRRKYGSDATYLSLAEAFLKMEDRVTAECIVTYFKEKPVNWLMTDRHSGSTQVFPDKVPQRYPNWNDLDDSEKRAIEQRLVIENHNVCIAYSSLLLDITIFFEINDTNPRHVKILLQGYIRGSRSDNSSQLSVQLSQTPESIDSLFLFIAEHTSWLNYHLLTMVVDKLGKQDSKKALKEYEDSCLMPYLKRCVFEIPVPSNLSSASTSSRLSLVRFCFKIPDDILVTGKEAVLVRDKLATLLEVPMLELEGHNAGCVELIFSLPQYIFDQYPHESPLHQYVKWNEETESYRVTANLLTVL